jgi:hypothetical protein
MLAEIAEFIKAVAPVFTAGAACVATYIGYKGLTKWQAEMLGKRRTELAEDVLSSFYQMRDIIAAIRSPAAFQGEGDTRNSQLHESDTTKKLRNTYFVPIARYQNHRQFFADLHAKRYRMKALNGDRSEAAFNKMDEALNNVMVAARMLISTADEDRAPRPQAATKWEAEIWGIGDEKDEVAKKINEAVALMEAVCRPLLEVAN